MTDPISRFRSEYVRQAQERFDRLLARVEALPVRVLLARMLVESWELPDSRRFRDEWDEAARAGIKRSGQNSFFLVSEDCMCACRVNAELELGSETVNVDFAFFGRRYLKADPEDGMLVKVAVDLSSPALEDRVAAEVSRDARRERLFMVAGWRALRFSGSDVLADAGKVLKGIVEAANQPWDAVLKSTS